MTTETPAAPITAAALAGTLQRISNQLEQIIAAQPFCFQCYAERVTAIRAGTPEDQLPTLRPVAVLLPVTAVISPAGELVLNGGGGACTAHVQIGDAPALPGRTASGLVLPGQGT